MRENAAAKRLIARHAVDLVGDGDSVMLDADTTTSMLARSGTELSLVPAIERRI